MLSPRSLSRDIYARQMRGSGLLGSYGDLSQAQPLGAERNTEGPPPPPPPLPRYEHPPAGFTKRRSDGGGVSSVMDHTVTQEEPMLPSPSPFTKFVPSEREPSRKGKSHVSPDAARMEFEEMRKHVKPMQVSVRNMANIGEGRSAPGTSSRRIFPRTQGSMVTRLGLSPRGCRLRGEQALSIADRARASQVINPSDSRIVLSLRTSLGGPEAWANAQKIQTSRIFDSHTGEAEFTERRSRRISANYTNGVLGSSRGMASALGGRPGGSGISVRPPSVERRIGKRIVKRAPPSGRGQVRAVQPTVPLRSRDMMERSRRANTPRVIAGAPKRESWTWSMKPPSYSRPTSSTQGNMAGG